MRHCKEERGGLSGVVNDRGAPMQMAFNQELTSRAVWRTVMRGYVLSRAMMPPMAPDIPSMAAFDAMAGLIGTGPLLQVSTSHLQGHQDRGWPAGRTGTANAMVASDADLFFLFERFL